MFSVYALYKKCTLRKHRLEKKGMKKNIKQKPNKRKLGLTILIPFKNDITEKRK
jgi:hypothetical protein